MCVGEPMRLSTVDGIVGRTGDGTLIDLSLTPDLRPGDWVLTFLGAARERLDPDEAQKILAALEGLRAVMAGGSAGDAFADIETREPTLPPHLQAALAAGAAQG
ncbi:hydrogenase [Rhodovulum sulfidophilum]|uniref:HypC/HybG/HupF family hydrogenase formation chaperone n=1 Tax=Rhodovulum sulfidophilum TaxID=35806 RepID=A0ABS1RUJ4_RHOSU|nr:HypC/HybG/HupF family hydrogenase formation chaperone [Rhodovulum sulfidophilum]MBK5924667.1 hydrogenase [Rhodovulum sulfidophilum]MBL3609767.1 HypC/HybG/HupF family hydrogenase formation chaperone [Rhodovulum sulfidophilum]MCE8456737.1 HypC/HybG/HupF family hydrogenase formation chaperone [Rhodovulum sulfidophilum]